MSECTCNDLLMNIVQKILQALYYYVCLKLESNISIFSKGNAQLHMCELILLICLNRSAVINLIYTFFLKGSTHVKVTQFMNSTIDTFIYDSHVPFIDGRSTAYLLMEYSLRFHT